LYLFILAIERAQQRLYTYYTNKQFIRPEHDWPPYHFKYFTPLAIIYENMHTNPATAASTAYISEDHVNKTTEDINSLFSAYRGCGSYKILIEGEPGIGKTILSSEIAAQWADRALLDDKALLFLLFMRQPETKNISNVKSLVEHFFCDDMPLVDMLTEWLISSNGRHLTILLDGYDEAATYSAFFDFVNEIIAHKILPKCGLVITSRPAESLHLHGRVDCRAEVLGFTEQSRKIFISRYIEKQEKMLKKQIYQTNKQDVIEYNIKKKIETVQNILKYNPIINTLCFIPLNITMLLLCLTESEEEIDLPTTITTLYEKFMIITIKRFLQAKSKCTDTIFTFKDVPNEYYQTFWQLSNFAYLRSIDIDDKKSMPLVFELPDLEKFCDLHGNGLGLLKPASFLQPRVQNAYSSYNFLHKSIQEYMAAYHIASLCPRILSRLLDRKFWDSSYFNVWIMYVGITKGKQKKFKVFLFGNRYYRLLARKSLKISTKIQDDKIKCLHLLRCVAEVQESSILTANIKLINISFNHIYSENLYRLCREIFKSWKTEKVILSLDSLLDSISIKKIEHFRNHLKRLIQTYQPSTGKLMISCQPIYAKIIVVYSDLNYVKCFQLHNCELTEDTALRLKTLIAEKLNNHTIGCVYLSYCVYNYEHYPVKMLSYIMENFQRTEFCGLNMHSKGAYLLGDVSITDSENDPSVYLLDFLAAVLQNNIRANTSSSYLSLLSEKVKEHTKRNISYVFTITVLDLTNNNMSDCTADDINLILSYNKLEEVYLSGNSLQEVGMIKIVEALHSNSSLKMFDISHNKINGKVVNSIAAALANKTKLEKLYLNENNLQSEDIIKITNKLCSTVLRIFNISQNICDSTAANNIGSIIMKNTQLEELHLGKNMIRTNGIIKMLSSLHITALKVFDISNNEISSKAAVDIAHVLSEQDKLEMLNLAGNELQDGLAIIVKKLKCYSTLKILDISNNNASIKTIDCIAIILCFQSKLEKLYLGGNNVENPKTIQALQYFLPLKEFDIPCTKISDKAEENVHRVVFKHMVHMQLLLLEHKDILANDYKLPHPKVRSGLKLNKAKINRSIGK